MRLRRGPVPLAMVVIVALLAGCVPAAAGGPGDDPRAGAGLAYGLAPEPDQGTTFQPDVVLVDGGGDSVVSVTSDGLTWTLEKSARGIADLAPGRIMFLTDRGVGRVMAVANTDAGVEVTIGPADITEVIAEGDFATTTPVDLTDPIALSGQGAFWADPDLREEAGVEPGPGADLPVDPASFSTSAGRGDLPRPPSPPAIVSDTVKATTGTFDLTAGCCATGPNTRLTRDKDGLHLDGKVAVDMSKPAADFKLRIAAGSVKEASLAVTGAAGFTAELHAKAEPNSGTAGFSPPLGLDYAFSVPIGVFFGVPLSMMVTQRFTVQINIPGSAVLDAVGKVKLGATLGFSYRNGDFTNLTTGSLDTSASLQGTESIAVGVSYASFDYNVRFTVGLGYLGFVAGVFVALGVHALAAVGAPFGFNIAPGAGTPIEHCKSIQASLWVDYGIGYTIPTDVAKLVNYFLKAFNATPIPTSGGISHGWDPVFTTFQAYPDTDLCR